MSQPQPPLDEQGEAHEALNSAVASYGPRILQNPQILGNVVTDLLPDLPREQSLLIAAADAGVASDLSQHVQDHNLDPGTAVQLAAHSLSDKKSIDATASMWVTTEYARVLGYPVPAYVPQSIPASTPPSVPSAGPGSVPPPSVPPFAQSVPPQSVPPQSVPPQSVPPWASNPAPQSQPGVGQQAVPPNTGWGGGGGPAGPWTSGPMPPGGPGMPPGGRPRNRGVLIGAAAAAAVLVLVLVTAAAARVGPFAPSKPAPSPTPSHVATTPAPSATSASPTATGPSNTDVANAIAGLVVGNDPPIGVMSSPAHGNATQANCDPSTVSNPPDPHTPTTASCDITYQDGTTWQQTVTVTYDDSGNPISASTNPGTQVG